MDETKATPDTGLWRVREIVAALCLNNCAPKPASEIAAMTGIPISSVIRNLKNLCEINWAVSRGDLYLIGTELVSVSRAYFIAHDHALKQIKLDLHMTELRAHELLETKN